MDEIIKDRNEAFKVLDKDKIIAYCKKYNIPIPEDEDIFWVGVHKTVCNLYLLENSPISKEQYDKSFRWLAKRGYGPSLTGGEK